MSDKYILDGKNAVPCGSLFEWAKWMERGDRRVAEDNVGEVRISTVFLGLDHSFGGATPVLFETMIFGGEHDEFQSRCGTWEEAEKMHAIALRMVKENYDPMPWCSACGARTQKQCDCGPIADND